MILPDNHITEFNGVSIKWFIGDINNSRAKELGLNPRWEGELGNVKLIDSGAYWEAWGSCNGHAYQMAAWFDMQTRELTNIHVLNDANNFYFNEETYNMLTK